MMKDDVMRLRAQANRVATGCLRAGRALVLGLVMLGSATGTALADRAVIAIGNAFDNLDPHQVFDVGRVASRLNLYDGLLRWEDNPPVLEPWLAESYEISEDGKTYTFTLREGAIFHDGTPITAEDVAWSMDRILGINKGAASLFVDVIEPGSTRALDARTVQFNLSKPSAIFLATVPEIHVVNMDLVKEHIVDDDWGQAWLSGHEAGSGSYALKRYDPAIGFQGERFAEHFIPWGEKYLDEVEFRYVMELNSRILGLIAGDFQVTDAYMPYDQIKRLEESGTVDINEQESMRIFYGVIHNNRAPMNDINFRKAINYAFDYDSFINDINSGSVARDPLPMPGNIWGAPSDVEGYSYDIEKAKEYMAKVEEPVRELTIGTITGYSTTEEAAALLQAGLAELGVPSKIVSDPFTVLNARSMDEQNTYDIYFTWKSTYYADPHNWVGELYSSSTIGSRNNSYYSNPDVDKLLDRALISTSMEERRGLYEDAARMVVDDAAGLFIYNTKWFGPTSKDLKGQRFSPIGNGLEARWMYRE
ncbi:ABC transporter substrate-binding protein [Salipiger abyssi]|uniref:ABC transporter substrate-binding protein n=1 Tax=Salipiger abyssi TaxID=1250539 RepID=UPI001A8EEA18|nr:ABC transporter substrate-binding protein [Salipiger abyssi]MBN9887217.1 ABC transporter substrate-binding protein [Salipiger abyssi]